MASMANTTGLPPGLALAWGVAPGPAPGRRGPKPAHSVAGIVEAAVALADAEGFGALSMPNIARRLGITANALYRYVSGRDEVLVLLAEAGWGPPPESVRRAGNWRDAVTGWVHAQIDRCTVHPWLLDLPIRGAPSTPNLVGWLEVLLEAMAGTGLRNRELLGCAVLLDGYARSTAMLARNLRESTAPQVQSMSAFLPEMLRERGFRRVAAMYGAGDYLDDERNDPAEVGIDFGLDRVLDGIEILVARRV
jgi:AcrR family transcriptional regulator